MMVRDLLHPPSTCPQRVCLRERQATLSVSLLTTDLELIVPQAVLPDQIEVRGELRLVLILVALDIPEHRREIHRLLDDCRS